MVLLNISVKSAIISAIHGILLQLPGETDNKVSSMKQHASLDENNMVALKSELFESSHWGVNNPCAIVVVEAQPLMTFELFAFRTLDTKCGAGTDASRV